jgi:hypothetical protein
MVCIPLEVRRITGRLRFLAELVIRLTNPSSFNAASVAIDEIGLVAASAAQAVREVTLVPEEARPYLP